MTTQFSVHYVRRIEAGPIGEGDDWLRIKLMRKAPFNEIDNEIQVVVFMPETEARLYAAAINSVNPGPGEYTISSGTSAPRDDEIPF